jgi:hypothetical protein
MSSVPETETETESSPPILETDFPVADNPPPQSSLQAQEARLLVTSNDVEQQQQRYGTVSGGVSSAIVGERVSSLNDQLVLSNND